MAVPSLYQLPLAPLDKRCNDCGKLKPREAFYRNRARPDGLQLRCIECHKDRCASHYRAHIEEFATRNRAYREAHREELNAKGRDRYRADPDKQKEYMKWYYPAHRERYQELDRKYNRINRKRRTDLARLWRKRNPESVRASWEKIKQSEKYRDNGRIATQRRRGRLHLAEGQFSLDEWRALCARFNNACICCNFVGPLTADHIIPLSRGGSNCISNIQPLCRSCNSTKGTKATDYRPSWSTNTGGLQ